jgi:hypothetical protein
MCVCVMRECADVLLSDLALCVRCVQFVTEEAEVRYRPMDLLQASTAFTEGLLVHALSFSLIECVCVRALWVCAG